MTRIPQDTIDRVRDTSDIVDVVSQYVDLKRRGVNFFGLCPFHSEKTPSFSVAPSKQIYHCFGCGSGGNAFSFLMEYQKISFPEAVKILAEKYNIPVQYEQSIKSSELFSALYELHEIAVKIYQENLFSDRGRQALDYLKERDLTEDIIKQFKIGFALASWDQMVNACKDKGFTQSQITKSGLFTQSEKGTFDRFRSRITYPIFHPSGKPIAFGGRIFGTDEPAKYLNSPETPLYKKSDVFYGIHATRDAVRKAGYAVLVEGYMDFLQLYQGGIHAVVAISGTALTPRHALALSRITNKAVLLYDGDSAGGNAAIRAGWVLLKSGMEPNIVRPPEGKDPDDWIREVGKDNILSTIESPVSFIDFHLDFHHGMDLKGSDRRQYIHELIQEIRNIRDGIIRDDLIRIIANKLKVDERELVKIMRSKRAFSMPGTGVEDSKKRDGPSFTSQLDRAQIELLKLLLHEDKVVRRFVKDKIETEFFTTPLLKKILERFLDDKLSMEPSTIIEYFQDENERDFVAHILITGIQDAPPKQIVSDCLKILKSVPLKEKIQKLRIKIREKETIGEDPQSELNELIVLQQELNNV